MYADNIIIKGNKEGLNVIIDMKKFRNSLDMTNALIEKLSKGKRFYRGCTLKITTQLKEFIAAFSLEPQIIRIADIMTRSPEDGIKPAYPEVARVKNGSIIVEPYLVNKYI